jgi:hypothetical protein
MVATSTLLVQNAKVENSILVLRFMKFSKILLEVRFMDFSRYFFEFLKEEKIERLHLVLLYYYRPISCLYVLL